jgi:hypothetical protein
MTDDTQWQPRLAALRDLFLLALERQDGIITDDTGRVASRLRELCQLGSSNSLTGTISEALRLMDEAGLIRRQVDDKHTRTYSIELLQRLDKEELAALAKTETATRSSVLGSSLASRLPDDTDPELVKLVEQCSDSYAAIVHATRDDKVRQLGALYALNVTGILRGRGIPTADIRRIKYYLRELGLAKADHAVDGDAQLWWWSVSTKALKCDSLLRLASGTRSYEHTRRGATATADNPVTTRRIGDAPAGTSQRASAAEDDRPAATAARPGPPPGRRAAAQPVVAQTTGGDTVGKLLGIITGLEARVEELTDAAETAEKEYRQALETKDGEIAELRRRLAEQQQTDERAASVLAKYGSK